MLGPFGFDLGFLHPSDGDVSAPRPPIRTRRARARPDQLLVPRSRLDNHRIDCFADVHSCSELVLYPWDHAPTQTTDPAQRFTTLPSGTCQPIQVRGFQEYMPPRDVRRFTTVAQRVADAIAADRGRVYTPQASIALYPTTGTQSDYAYSRHIADPAKRKVFGYNLETGPSLPDVRESFHPSNPDPIKEEAESGLLALVQQVHLRDRAHWVPAARARRRGRRTAQDPRRVPLHHGGRAGLDRPLRTRPDPADRRSSRRRARPTRRRPGGTGGAPGFRRHRRVRRAGRRGRRGAGQPARRPVRLPSRCGVTSPRWRAGCACRAARVPTRSSKG